ncbi:MAG: hypothetical protein IV106_07195 [Pseudomonas umsongensis]|nr:hypothetical protein [Pseudomonas umsongensis]
MSHQFKPGDQAMIVGANSLTQNIGKQCELRQFIVKGDLYIAPNGETYRHDDVPCWVVAGEGLYWVADAEPMQGDFGVHEPRHLMPLYGNTNPEQQKALEVTL